MNNNRNNRRRGRNNNRNQGGSNSGNRIDSRARGNAPQLLDKYKKLAQDAQHNGDRVQAEYYLQFADHYFRVIADNKARQDEARSKRDEERQSGDDSDLMTRAMIAAATADRGPAGMTIRDRTTIAVRNVVANHAAGRPEAKIPRIATSSNRRKTPLFARMKRHRRSAALHRGSLASLPKVKLRARARLTHRRCRLPSDHLTETSQSLLRAAAARPLTIRLRVKM